MERIDHLRRDIAQRESELASLRAELALAESEERAREHQQDPESSTWQWPLKEVEYERYSRQMIVPKFGLSCMSSLFYPHISSNYGRRK